MKITTISASGIISNTEEVLPDRENLTPTRPAIGGNCRKTNERLCKSSDLCDECAHALDRIMARLGPPKDYSEAEIAAMKAHAKMKAKKYGIE